MVPDDSASIFRLGLGPHGLLGRSFHPMPIMLKQYLRLAGRVVAFNRDPRFSEVWDCLLDVDLRRAPDALLARYLGKDGLAAHRAYHAVPGDGDVARVA